MAVYDLSITDGLLSTTRAVRKRLDFERPVSNDIIRACLQLALQAPTGTNRRVGVGSSLPILTSARLWVRSIAEVPGHIWRTARGTRILPGPRRQSRVFLGPIFRGKYSESAGARYPCITVDQLPVDPPRYVWPGLMGSILPAVWSFQLALRARGLGSTFTTLHLRRGDEAAELLGIPSSIMQVGLVPVAYTIGTDFKPAHRPPLDDITHWEQW